MLGARKDIPESGEFDSPIAIYKRVDRPADDFGAKQEDTLIWQGFGAIRAISSLVYWNGAQVSDRATHYLYVDYIANMTDPKTLGHVCIVKLLDEDRVFRIGRGMETKTHFSIKYELVELGEDNPEGVDSSFADEVIND